MIGLDTNVLLRLVTADDPAQAALARNLMHAASLAGRRLFINRIVLCETVWVLQSRYRLSSETVAMILDRILRDEDFEVEDHTQALLALDFFRDGLDFPDAYFALTNRTAGCTTTFTFDRRAARLADFQLISA